MYFFKKPGRRDVNLFGCGFPLNTVDEWRKKKQETSCIEVSGIHSPGGSGDCCWTKCPQVLSQGKTALVALC